MGGEGDQWQRVRVPFSPRRNESVLWARHDQKQSERNHTESNKRSGHLDSLVADTQRPERIINWRLGWRGSAMPSSGWAGVHEWW